MERISYEELPANYYETIRSINEYICESTLDQTLKQLISIRASQMNGCAYCLDMNHKILKSFGETDLRLSSIVVWRDTPYFSDKERAVLALTEELTSLQPAPVSEPVFNDLISHFSKEEIAYLILQVAQINSWNRIMKTLGTTPGEFEVTQ